MTARLNPVQRIFDLKVRSVRWIEIFGVLLVAALVLSVYVAKAAAAREGARITELERQIGENHERVRLLRAEAARLEQPGRLEALSRGIGMGPVNVHRQAEEGRLPALAAEPAVPAPAPVVPEAQP